MDNLSDNRGSHRQRLIRVPLAPVAAALACGIAAGRYLPLPVAFWLVFLAASVAAAAVTFFWRHLGGLCGACLLAAIAAAGGAHIHNAAFALSDSHIATYAGLSRIPAAVRGKIVTFPQVRSVASGMMPGYHQPPRTKFILRAEAIRLKDGHGRAWRPTEGLVEVTVSEPDDRLTAGQTVEMLGWLGRRCGGADNPGQTAPDDYARKTGVFAWFSAPCVGAVKIAAERSPRWHSRILWRLRASARQHLHECGDGRAAGLLSAMIIGRGSRTAGALGELNDAMIRGGIAHFLSISGLHLGVFLGFVYFLCRLLTLTPRRSAAAVIVVLGAYVLLAQPRAPLMRSAIMAAALCLSVMLGRRASALNALALAAIILLALDPLKLFHAGFQLSFTIVGGLIILHHPMRRLLFGRWLRRRGLMVFRGEQRLRRWWYYRAGNWLINLVTLSLTAYLCAAPLVAHHFGLFSPYAPLLSVLAFPLVALVLVGGYVSLALAWVLPNLSWQVGRLAGIFAEWLAGAVELMGRAPWLSLELRPVGALWVITVYAAVAAVLLLRGRGRKYAAVAAVVVVAAATAWTQRTAPAPGAGQLDVLSVGAGQCIVLRTGDGSVYILDAGTRSGFDAYGFALSPFLRAGRFPRPSATFISHANTDHYNALPEPLSRGRLERVYLNDYFGHGAGGEEADGAELDFMRILNGSGVDVVRLRAGSAVRLDDSATAEILWPPPARDDLSANDTSLVMRITCNGQSVLVTGDLDEVGQTELAGHDRLDADVLVMPHHGGWKPTLPAFVDAVDPKVVIVSNSHDPAGAVEDERRRHFYKRLRNNYRYYSTYENGWVRVRFGDGPVTVEAMRE